MSKNIFVIAGEQRSGTMMLGDVLSSHPSISVSSEVFLNFPSEYDSYFKFLAVKVKTDPDAIFPEYERIVENVSEFFCFLEKKAGGATVGIHLKYDQLKYVSALDSVLRDLGVIVIHNIRRNCLDTILSQHLLRARITAHLPAHTGADSIEPNVTMKMPDAGSVFSEVIQLVGRIYAHRARLSRCRVYHECFYEDLVSTPKEMVLENIQRTLGVTPTGLTSTIRKSTRLDIRNAIKNPVEYDTLLRLLEDVEYHIH